MNLNEHLPSERPRPRSRAQARAAGFTLIELLTVISIIALLATIGAALSGVAIRKARESRMRAEQGKLTTAIEGYRADLHQYPPDNARSGVNVDPALHQLYYELSGSVAGKFRPEGQQGEVYRWSDNPTGITSVALTRVFGTGGFVNSVEEPQKPKGYLSDLNQRQRRYVELKGHTAVELLAVSGLDWPTKNAVQTQYAPLARSVGTNVAYLAVNPWHYVSTRPTNNPGSFDLWALLPSGKVINGTNEYRILGNWKE